MATDKMQGPFSKAFWDAYLNDHYSELLKLVGYECRKYSFFEENAPHDLLHQIYATKLRSLSQFDPERNISPSQWIAVLARFNLHNQAAIRKRLQKVQFEIFSTESETAAETIDRLDPRLKYPDNLARLRNDFNETYCMLDPTPREQQLLAWYLLGYTYTEQAQKWHVTPSGMSKQINRIFQRMRALLKQVHSQAKVC